MPFIHIDRSVHHHHYYGALPVDVKEALAKIKASADAEIARQQATVADLRAQLAAAKNQAPALAPDDEAEVNAITGSLDAADPQNPATLPPAPTTPAAGGTEQAKS